MGKQEACKVQNHSEIPDLGWNKPVCWYR